MNRKRFLKKTVSMVLVCAMLGGSFAQYTFAEEDPELDIVIEPEELVLEDVPELPVDSVAENGMDSEEAGTEAQETLDSAAAEGQEAADQTAEEGQAVSEQPAAQESESSDSFEVDLNIEEITVEDPAPELASENEGAVAAALLGEDDGASQIATISGSATVESDFNYVARGEGIRITGLKDAAKTKTDLLIPESIEEKPVLEIGDGAFKECANFTGKLTLPSTLETIGANAFLNCPFTGALTIPASLKNIGYGAFEGCSKFTGGLDFSACTDLSIAMEAFFGCTGLNGKLTLPADTSLIDKDAFFKAVRMENGDSPYELQMGNVEMKKLRVLAQDSKLALSDEMVDWSSSDASIVSVNAGMVTAHKAGTATITAKVRYNNALAATKQIVVLAKDVVPTVASINFASEVLKPGTFNLSLGIVSENKGVKTLSGYFCLLSDTSQKISFSCDWTKEPKYSGEVKDIAVKISSNYLTGAYCLGGLTLTNTDNKSTTYTYDTATGTWLNDRNNQTDIILSPSNNKLTIKDGFGKTDGGIDAYITSPNITALLKSQVQKSATTAVIQYDNNQHTVKKEWFEAIKGQDITLVLTNGIVEWCFYGKDIKTAKDIDCLVTVAKADTSGYGNTSVSMSAEFVAANAVLPGKATVRIHADQMNKLYEQTKKLFLFSVNADTSLSKAGTLEYVLSGGQNWYEFEVTDNTNPKLLMSGKDLTLAPEYKVTKLTLNKTKVGLQKGKTAKLTVTVTPANATNKAVKWTSSNKKVATVTAKGKIKAKRFGTATIKVTAQDGSKVSASCKVTVGYKIQYKLKGGKNNKNNPTAYYKQTIKLKKPTRKGYTFQGWYTDSDYRHRIKKITTSYKINLTLYAKWKKN